MGAEGGMRMVGRIALSPQPPAPDALDARFQCMPSAVASPDTKRVHLAHEFALRVTMVACVR